MSKKPAFDFSSDDDDEVIDLRATETPDPPYRDERIVQTRNPSSPVRRLSSTSSNGTHTRAQLLSNSQEHYTPGDIVARAYALMGGIDLDPASCFIAQRTVQAKQWYGWDGSAMVDGLRRQWYGSVFLNPPGGHTSDNAPELVSVHKSYAAIWWGKLMASYQDGEVSQAVFVGFSLELLRSVQSLPFPHPLTFPTCIPKQRIKFIYPWETVDLRPTLTTELHTSLQPTHANFVTWLPPKGVEIDEGHNLFRGHFSSLGICV